jgi:carbonic anhydrase
MLSEPELISSCLQIPNPLDIPLREFINFVSQDDMAMYKGSLTEAGCPSTVTWLINLTPHVIKTEQLNEIKSLLD